MGRTWVMAVLAMLLLTASKPEDVTPGGLVTLWAHDDLRAAFSFERGEFITEIRDGELILDEAQIVFDLLEFDHLSYGFYYNEEVQIVDLGDFRVPPYERPQDLSPKPDLSVFHTLFLDGNRFHYRGPIRKSYRLKEADAVLGSFPSPHTTHFIPEVGSVYVMAFKPRGSSAGEANAFKFQVVDYRPGRSLTLRWSKVTSGRS
jgi:hypothetical protein